MSYSYYYVEVLAQDGVWEMENGFMTRAEAMTEKRDLVGGYAEWLPNGELRHKDIRVRKVQLQAGYRDPNIPRTLPA